jgi:hypothetical protein
MNEPRRDPDARAVAAVALRQVAIRLRRKLPGDERLARISVQFDHIAADLERRARR